MKQLAVFGFGLIGASLCAAVREAEPGTRIVAVDLTSVVRKNSAQGVLDEFVDSADRGEVRRVAEASDLCVLATPVAAIVAELPNLLEWAEIVTDCGSTKRTICGAVSAAPRRGRFVPGHPMAGGPEGGAGQGRADLFRGQTWLLCPESSDHDALVQVESMVHSVGARVIHLTLAEHDRALAYTSHAPQIMASALATLAHRADAIAAAGPAYRAMTRSAGGAQVMWRDILDANADEVSVALHQLAAALETVADGLAADPHDLTAALALLAEARAVR
jgi:prephenate dehydrogenase